MVRGAALIARLTMGEVKVPEKWAIRAMTISIGDELARAIGAIPTSTAG